MADLSGLGDLVLTVGGDISSFEAALSEIPAVAQEAASQIQAAFDAIPSATQDVESSLANLSANLTEAGNAAGSAVPDLEAIPPALHDTSTEAEEAGAKLKEFVTAGLELAGIALSFEAVKEAVTEIVSAFDQLQRATISLTALTGSAEQANTAIDALKTMAIGEGLSFPSLVQAQQRMFAFGISASQIPSLLQAAANAAAVMGTDIDSAASKLDRIAVSGTVAARQLTSLGLTTHDLAQAMGVADSAVKSTFASMDQSQRVDVLIASLQKFQGVAAAVAETLSGQWQSFKTSVEVALEGVGEAIDTGLTSAVQTAQSSVVPGIQAMVQAFTALASVVGPGLSAAVNGVIQTLGDLETIIGSATTEVIKLATEAAGMVPSSKAATVSWEDFFNVIIPGKAAIHDAAVEIELLSADAVVLGKSADIMAQRFASVTDSLKAFIDKTSASDDSLLAIRQAFDDLKQSVSDAQDKLALVTDAYNKGMASAGQLEAATKALTAAQTALNGTLDTSHLTMQGIATEYDSLKTALATAQSNLTLVATAYAQGTASLAQYETALGKVNSAQDALNGSMRQTPAQDVANQFQTLQDNLSHAQRYLEAVTDALKTGGATMTMYESAVSAVNAAQVALTGTSQQVTTAVSGSAPKIIDVANALNSMAAASGAVAAQAANFVGPVQQAGNAIQVFSGSTVQAAGGTNQLINGVQVLTGSLPGSLTDLTAKSRAAGDAAIYMGDHWASAADVIKNAAQTMKTAAQQLQEVADAAHTAADQMQEFDQAMGDVPGVSLGASLDQTMNAQIGGFSMTLKPGDVFRSPNIGSTGIMGGYPNLAAQETNIFGSAEARDQAIINEINSRNQFAQTLQQLNQALAGGTPSVTSAADALTTAAQTQTDAAQAAYDAAKAATVGATTQQTAAAATQQAADAISASALAAADAANQAAFNNAGLASIIQQTNTAVQQASTVAAASTSLVSTALVALGKPPIVSGSNTFTPFAPSLPSVPGSGPSGYSSGGLAFAQPVFPSGPVNVNVSGSQFLSSLMNEFVRSLANQGIRVTRG